LFDVCPICIAIYSVERIASAGTKVVRDA
jgi:hypothetical protein